LLTVARILLVCIVAGIIFFVLSVVVYFKVENFGEVQELKAKRTTLTKTQENFVLMFNKFFGSSQVLNNVQRASLNFSSIPKVIAIFYEGKSKMVLIKNGGKTEWIKEGAVVNGWKVKKILPSEVIFEAKGTTVEKKIFSFNGSRGNMGKTLKEGGQNKVIVISREEMQRLTSDIGSLFSQIGLRPYFIGGRIAGMYVAYIKPGSIFAKAGLKEGDIILTINNIPIRTTEDSYRIFETLKTASYIEVRVRRGNQILTFRAEVR